MNITTLPAYRHRPWSRGFNFNDEKSCLEDFNFAKNDLKWYNILKRKLRKEKQIILKYNRDDKPEYICINDVRWKYDNGYLSMFSALYNNYYTLGRYTIEIVSLEEMLKHHDNYDIDILRRLYNFEEYKDAIFNLIMTIDKKQLADIILGSKSPYLN